VKAVFKTGGTGYTLHYFDSFWVTGDHWMSEELFERRKEKRSYALNFLDYEILSNCDAVSGRGLARTLNVSRDGLRLETGQFFEPGQKLRIALGLRNDLVQVTGRVTNSQPENDELCSSGVLFVEFAGKDRDTYLRHYEDLKTVLG
jgi:hypothetical protein